MNALIEQFHLVPIPSLAPVFSLHKVCESALTLMFLTAAQMRAVAALLALVAAAAMAQQVASRSMCA